MSSSANFFHHLDREGLLARLPVKYETPKWLTRHSDILNDKITTVGYSGIGIMSNTQYLQKLGIPAPKSWVDLSDPIYQGHLTMTTPANSGTMQLMVENVLKSMAGSADGRSYSKPVVIFLPFRHVVHVLVMPSPEVLSAQANY